MLRPIRVGHHSHSLDSILRSIRTTSSQKPQS
ncbi:hypothetical protein ERO13_A12G081632v2 [Gossypium hirsutum]|nr:hypothetical protein ERO13_A12G081632v2 [Gossypium hirsutum]